MKYKSNRCYVYYLNFNIFCEHEIINSNRSVKLSLLIHSTNLSLCVSSTLMKSWTLSTKTVRLHIVCIASTLCRLRMCSQVPQSTISKTLSALEEIFQRRSLSTTSKKTSAANPEMEFKSRLGKMTHKTRSWCTSSAYSLTWPARTLLTSETSLTSSSSTTCYLSTLKSL